MNARQERSIARLRKIEFNLGIIKVKGTPPLYAASVVKLKATLGRIEKLEREQFFASPGQSAEGKSMRYARKRLRRDYMLPLRRTARRLLAFAPGIESAMVVPHARASYAEVVAAAERMLKAIRPHRKLVNGAGLAPRFLTDFREHTRELKRLSTSASARQATHARVSDELREELKLAHDTVLIIESLLFQRMDHDRELAKTWKEAVRTPKRLGRPKKEKRLPPRATTDGAVALEARA